VKSHYGEAVHNLKIIPLCEKSGQSTGKEVLVYGILVKKRYTSTSGADYNNSEDLNNKLEIKKIVNDLNSSVGL
jgi:hypothetical protein